MVDLSWTVVLGYWENVSEYVKQVWVHQGGVIARHNVCQTPLLEIDLLALCEGSKQGLLLWSSPPGWPTQMAKALGLLVRETPQSSCAGDGDADGFLRNIWLAFLGTKLCPCTSVTTTTALSQVPQLLFFPTPKSIPEAALRSLSPVIYSPPTPHVLSQPTHFLIHRPTPSMFGHGPTASYLRSQHTGGGMGGEPLFLYCQKQNSPTCSRRPHLNGVTTRSACLWFVTFLFTYHQWFLD